MRTVAFDGSFAAWRAAARALLAAGVPPERVRWAAIDARADDGARGAAAQPSLPLDAPGAAPDDAVPAPPAPPAPRVPRRFVELADLAACHADPNRWALLYRLLWRLAHGEPGLLDVPADDDVRRLARLARAVSREVHRCHAFVRFRAVADGAGGETYVAWFEPEHDVLPRAAPLFVRRFAAMRWAILSPGRSVRWDGTALAVGPGVPRAAAPDGDALEALWRTYYGHVFNPARVKLRALRAELPPRYWRNLPEAADIPRLVRDAPARVRRMLDAAGGPPAADAGDPAPDGAPASVHALPAHAPAPLVVDGGGAIRVGTASWTDPTLLAAGVGWYPAWARTPEARLRVYASRFPLVEVDASYYAVPTRRMAELWAARAPAGFVFDVKAHAAMTGHPVELRRLPADVRAMLPPSLAAAERARGDALPAAVVEAIWARFLDALAPLGAAGRQGALLLQFPRWFTPSRASADRLAALRARLADWYAAGHLAAVELRHRDWFAPRIAARTLALLERLELVHVIVDAPPGHASSVPWVPAATHPRLAVVRLHGRRVETWEARVAVVSERYRYRYDAGELAAFVGDVVDVARQVQGAHVVFNNCHADYGVTNAAELAALLARRDAARRLVDG